MDIVSASVGAIFLAIGIVPFVLFYVKRVQKEKKMLQDLMESATENKGKISRYEFCSDFVVGLDEEKKFVCFVKQKRDEKISQTVELSQFQSCQSFKKTRSIVVKNEDIQITERVELVFIPNDKSNKEISFELFDELINSQLSGELQFVEKWTRIISENM